jgi:arginine-tRNA-protein transferase
MSLYASPPHECAYLPGHEAITVFVDPRFPKTPALYGHLARQGFRRSGGDLYRPHCPACRQCVPVRVPVQAFQARRSQRRVWEKNRDLQARECPPLFRQEQFDLYRAYLAGRHRGGGMDNPSPSEYLRFLTAPWADSVFYEFRLGGELLGVAVADCFDDGLSAVYSFFHPAHAQRSLGVYLVLWEIEQARRLGLEYLYLGYWIRDSRKMRYKTDYQPLEYFVEGGWQNERP